MDMYKVKYGGCDEDYTHGEGTQSLKVYYVVTWLGLKCDYREFVEVYESCLPLFFLCRDAARVLPKPPVEDKLSLQNFQCL